MPYYLFSKADADRDAGNAKQLTSYGKRPQASLQSEMTAAEADTSTPKAASGCATVAATQDSLALATKRPQKIS